jgi:hypothetical protein
MIPTMRSSPLAVAALLLVNLLPLAGVLFLGWNLRFIMLLYWLENGVIGLFNIARMAFAASTLPKNSVDVPGELSNSSALGMLGKLFMIPFFAFHYGMFWAVHGVFVGVLFGVGESAPAHPRLSPFALLRVFAYLGSSDPMLVLAVLLLFISHGMSFVLNYLGQREHLQVSVGEQMMRPYSRVVVLHATIVIGGFLVMGLGQPVYALLLMVVLKTAVDLRAHLREHSGTTGTVASPTLASRRARQA